MANLRNLTMMSTALDLGVFLNKPIQDHAREVTWLLICLGLTWGRYGQMLVVTKTIYIGLYNII